MDMDDYKLGTPDSEVAFATIGEEFDYDQFDKDDDTERESELGKWKLHHYENGEWKRVYTGLPEDATECSPTAELVGGRWRISFIAGGHESDRRFYLYKIDGIGNVPEKVVAADVGFVFKNRIVYGGRSGGLYVVNGEHMQKLTFPDVEYFYRVSYNPDNPSEWLISGQTKSGGIFSRICKAFA